MDVPPARVKGLQHLLSLAHSHGWHPSMAGAQQQLHLPSPLLSPWSWPAFPGTLRSVSRPQAPARTQQQEASALPCSSSSPPPHKTAARREQTLCQSCFLAASTARMPSVRRDV
jgi:hypothetical protein